MKNIGYMVSFVSAMMGVAFPLLLRLISEVDDRYGSMELSDRFTREPVYRLFVYSLVCSIASSILWISGLLQHPDSFIEEVLILLPDIWLLLFGVMTTCYFFLTVSLVIKYYDPLKIARRLLQKRVPEEIVKSTHSLTLISKHDLSKKPNGKLAKRVHSMLYYTTKIGLLNEVPKSNTHFDNEESESLIIVGSIIQTYTRAGRLNTVNKLLPIFLGSLGNRNPSDKITSEGTICFDMLRRVFSTLVKVDDRDFSKHAKAILTNSWLPQRNYVDTPERSIFRNTWYNIIEVINRDRGDLFMEYWKAAFEQARDYKYNHEIPDLSDGGIDRLMLRWIEKANEREASARITQSPPENDTPDYLEQFVNLDNKLLPLIQYVCYHTYIGGLLFFKQKYELIRRVFAYTTSMPPKYYLLPDTFTEVFRLFLMSHDRFDLYYSITPTMYVFPDLEGVNKDDFTREFICNYTAVLYIRLFSLFPSYRTTYQYDPQSLPDTKFSLNNWKESADYLKRITDNLIKNKEIIQRIGFDHLITSNEKAIINNLDEFIKAIQDKIESIAINYQPTSRQIEYFLNNVTNSLSESIDTLMIINNKNDILSDYSSWHINGANRLLHKDDFQIDSFSISTVLYPLITNKQSNLYNSFVAQNATRYLVTWKDLFPAVEKLRANAEQHILIGFNINLSYYIKALKIKDLSDNEFKGIELHLFNVSSRHSSSSLFLVRKTDLPRFNFSGSKQADIDKFHMEERGTKYHIFSSLLDMNKHKQIADELRPSSPSIKLEKSLLACVDYHIEIRWKNAPDMIHLQVYNRDMSQGIPVEIKDIEPISYSE